MYTLKQEFGIIFLYMFVYGISEIFVEKYFNTTYKKMIYYTLFLIVGLHFLRT